MFFANFDMRLKQFSLCGDRRMSESCEKSRLDLRMYVMYVCRHACVDVSLAYMNVQIYMFLHVGVYMYLHRGI